MYAPHACTAWLCYNNHSHNIHTCTTGADPGDIKEGCRVGRKICRACPLSANHARGGGGGGGAPPPPPQITMIVHDGGEHLQNSI